MSVARGNVDDLVRGSSVVTTTAALPESRHRRQHESHYADHHGFAGHHGDGAQTQGSHHPARQRHRPAPTADTTATLPATCEEKSEIMFY